MDKLVIALGPALAAGFALQQLLEILTPLLEKLKLNKKLFLSLLSLVIGLAFSFGAGLRVLQPLGVTDAGVWDLIVTGLIISAGTEGFNSIMKFMGYTKEQSKADAAKKLEQAPEEALAQVEKI